MKIVLYIDGKPTKDYMKLDFETDSLFRTKLNLAIGLMKIEKGWKMIGKEWEIFLVHKSKMK